MSELSYFFFEGFLMGTYQQGEKGIVFAPFKRYSAIQHLKNKTFPDDDFLHEAVTACFSPTEIRAFRAKRARIERQIEDERIQSVSFDSGQLGDADY